MQPGTRFVPRRDRIRNALALAGVLLVPLGLKLAWWARNTALPYWDDASYLEMALRMFDTTVARGLLGLRWSFLHATAPREPLIAAQALPFFLFFGRSIAAAQLVNLIWVALQAVYVYRFCRVFWPRAAALTAVLTTAACPLLCEMNNAYLREGPLTALVVMTAYALATSEGLRRRKSALALGALLGVAMLYRGLYPLYVAGLYAAALGQYGLRISDCGLRIEDCGLRSAECGERSDGNKRAETGAGGSIPVWRIVGNLALVAGVGALICGPWYVVNGGGLLRQMSLASAGKIAQDYGSAEVLRWPVIRDYLAGVARYGVSVWNLALAGLGVACCGVALGRGRVRLGELLPWGGALFLAGWAAPFAVFLFGVNKATRFITPLLPAFGIALGVLLWGAARAWRRAGVLAGAGLAVGFLVLVWAQFGVGAGLPAWNGAMKTLSGGIAVRRAEASRWPYAEIIRFARRAATRRKAADCSVMLLSDSTHFNIDLLQLWATLEGLPLELRSSVRLRYDEAGLRALFEKSDVVLAKEGGERDLDFKNPGPALLAGALARHELTPLNCPIALPDGGRLQAWKRQGADLPHAAAHRSKADGVKK